MCPTKFSFLKDAVGRFLLFGYTMRGALLGAAILPIYYFARLSLPVADAIYPAIFGMLVLSAIGASIGYCWSNIAGSFNFSLPSSWMTPSKHAPSSTGFSEDDLLDDDALHPSKMADMCKCYPPCNWSGSCDSMEERLLKMRGIVSGDWRDEYSSPSSREEDDRNMGVIP